MYDKVRQVLTDTVPTLDRAGFHVTLIELSDDGQRIRLGYNEPVEAIPPALVSAIAAVTRTGVDFVHGGTVSIAAMDASVAAVRQPTRSIEELLTTHEV
ncbi:MAG: hypothetical protein QOH99_1098 [Frankiaceae bacterium]|nr:hypothetical protein [Frankiaceae bacterium]